jgi:hypothetical protein
MIRSLGASQFRANEWLEVGSSHITGVQSDGAYFDLPPFGRMNITHILNRNIEQPSSADACRASSCPVFQLRERNRPHREPVALRQRTIPPNATDLLGARIFVLPDATNAMGTENLV